MTFDLIISSYGAFRNSQKKKALKVLHILEKKNIRYVFILDDIKYIRPFTVYFCLLVFLFGRFSLEI